MVVSHGGVGGARAVEQVKLVLNAKYRRRTSTEQRQRTGLSRHG